MIQPAFALHKNSRSFFPLYRDSVDERTRYQGQIVAMEDGFEKGLGGRLSSTLVDGSLCGCEAFLLVRVVVGEGSVSCLFRRLDEGCIERMFVLRTSNAELSFCATPW